MKGMLARTFFSILLLSVFIFVEHADLLAQGSGGTINRTFGLGTSVQLKPREIYVPVWVSQQMLIIPEIGLRNQENIGTELQLGLSLKYLLTMARLAPFIGLRGFTQLGLPENGPSTTALAFALLFGAEFFLHNQFAFCVDAGVQVWIPDSALINQYRIIETCTRLMVFAYF